MNKKQVVLQYIEGFNQSDHAKILSCLTEDVVWYMPGFFDLKGKKQFDSEIENKAFVGKPVVTISRLVEENNVVVAEGAVMAHMKDGGILDALFCDVFEFEQDKIRKLTTYLMQRNARPSA